MLVTTGHARGAYYARRARRAQHSSSSCGCSALAETDPKADPPTWIQHESWRAAVTSQLSVHLCLPLLPLTLSLHFFLTLFALLTLLTLFALLRVAVRIPT